MSHSESPDTNGASLPFTLRFEARCKLCDFTTGIDVTLDDRSPAEVVAVDAVIHAERVHGRRRSPAVTARGA